jgi:hypothetical protein
MVPFQGNARNTTVSAAGHIGSAFQGRKSPTILAQIRAVLRPLPVTMVMAIRISFGNFSILAGFASENFIVAVWSLEGAPVPGKVAKPVLENRDINRMCAQES